MPVKHTFIMSCGNSRICVSRHGFKKKEFIKPKESTHLVQYFVDICIIIDIIGYVSILMLTLPLSYHTIQYWLLLF